LDDFSQISSDSNHEAKLARPIPEEPAACESSESSLPTPELEENASPINKNKAKRRAKQFAEAK